MDLCSVWWQVPGELLDLSFGVFCTGDWVGVTSMGLGRWLTRCFLEVCRVESLHRDGFGIELLECGHHVHGVLLLDWECCLDGMPLLDWEHCRPGVSLLECGHPMHGVKLLEP